MDAAPRAAPASAATGRRCIDGAQPTDAAPRERPLLSKSGRSPFGGLAFSRSYGADLRTGSELERPLCSTCGRLRSLGALSAHVARRCRGPARTRLARSGRDTGQRRATRRQRDGRRTRRAGRQPWRARERRARKSPFSGARHGVASWRDSPGFKIGNRRSQRPALGAKTGAPRFWKWTISRAGRGRRATRPRRTGRRSGSCC